MDGLPAILETSNPANVEVYRRAGWEVLVATAEPLTIWIMQQSTAQVFRRIADTLPTIEVAAVR